MPEIRLPLWLVTERGLKEVPAIEQLGTDRSPTILAFTRTEQVAQVLRTANAGQWKIDLASDSTELLLLLADHHSQGVTHICLDPEPDGSGGELVSLGDAFALARSASEQGI